MPDKSSNPTEHQPRRHHRLRGKAENPDDTTMMMGKPDGSGQVTVMVQLKEMKYSSTRAGTTGVSFEEALFSGFAPDGGLFMPERIPEICLETLAEWRKNRLTYPQVVAKIVRLYVVEDELPDQVLQDCVQRAYAKFDDPSVVKLHQLKSGGGNEDEIVVAELFHGKTASFKDYALSLVGQLIQYFVNTRKKHVTIVIGTSGDTGSAAIEAVRGLPGVDVIVLFPKGKVSPVQELQMVTVEDENVHLFEVEGTSDDLDVPIKQAFPQAGLISINSINWARIMIQVAHYVYISVVAGEGVEVVVPTGAAGNALSGVIANLMGVPIKLHVATNRNDAVDLLLRQGKLRWGGHVWPTPANAMDIGTPYNVERLLYLFSDAPTITSIMTKAESGQNPAFVDIPQDIIARISNVVLSSVSIDTELIYTAIKNCWEENHYMVCPHTATALALIHSKLTCPSSHSSGATACKRPFYILSTASPYKFPESALQAGIPTEEWNGESLLRRLEQIPRVIPKRMSKGEDWAKMLQEEINSTKSGQL